MLRELRRVPCRSALDPGLGGGSPRLGLGCSDDFPRDHAGPGVKRVDFAYAMKRVSDGFNVAPLNEIRGAALFEEWGGLPDEAVNRAVAIMLQGDRYPNATGLRKAFEEGRVWYHEQRKARWNAQDRKRGKVSAGQVLEELGGMRTTTAHPLVPQVCVQAFRMLSAGYGPDRVADFYRKMAREPGLEFMNLDEEAAALEELGGSWPDPPELFPVSFSKRHDRPQPAAPTDTGKPVGNQPGPEQGGLW